MKTIFIDFYIFIKESKLLLIAILTILILFFSYSYVGAYFNQAIDIVKERVFDIKI